MKKFNKKLLVGTLGVITAFMMSTSVFAAVSVKITGDSDHEPKQHTAYETWLETDCDFTNGMTAKDALFNALEKGGLSYVYYDDSNYLYSITSDKGITLPGKSNVGYGGWMYNVNGTAPSVGLADYLLADNDAVEVYYIDDYRDIYGYGAKISVTPDDAEVKIFDGTGNEMIDYGWGYSLPKGKYTYTVKKLGYKTLEDSFEIVDDDAVINAVLEKKTDVVTAKIYGDNVHEAGAHSAYTLWAGSEFTPEDGGTAEKYVTELIKSFGGEIVYNEQYGYISAVKTAGGETVGEFTNGDKSGWIYTVNGESPSVALRDYKVKAGDEIVFHYYDDYREFYGYTVTINTTPSAKVTVANAGTGEEIAENPWGGYSLLPGNYLYTAELDGYFTAADNFEVTNDDITIDVELEPTEKPLYGDYNLDGKVLADDAANILQKALVSTFPAPADDIAYIDINQNGSVDAEDAAFVMQKVLVSTFKLPCEA